MNTGTGGALEDADLVSGRGLRLDHTCTRMHVHAGALVTGEQLSVRVCIQRPRPTKLLREAHSATVQREDIDTDKEVKPHTHLHRGVHTHAHARL